MYMQATGIGGVGSICGISLPEPKFFENTPMENGINT